MGKKNKKKTTTETTTAVKRATVKRASEIVTSVREAKLDSGLTIKVKTYTMTPEAREDLKSRGVELTEVDNALEFASHKEAATWLKAKKILRVKKGSRGAAKTALARLGSLSDKLEKFADKRSVDLPADAQDAVEAAMESLQKALDIAGESLTIK